MKQVWVYDRPIICVRYCGVDGGFELDGLLEKKKSRIKYEDCHTPGSESNVPFVVWPRTRLPPVEMLPDPIGS